LITRRQVFPTKQGDIELKTKKTYIKRIITMIFSDRLWLSFIASDDYNKYLTLFVVLFIVRHLDVLGEFKISGRCLCPVIVRLRVQVSFETVTGN